MKSVKCPECGFVGWADAERCKKCGVSRMLDSDPADGSYEPTPSHHYQAADRVYAPGELKKGLAIASMVIGILDLFSFGLLGLGAIAGITLSIVALSNAKRNPREYGGQSMATAGLVLSILSIVMIVPLGIVAAIVIPNVIASRRAANESASIATLRSIQSAQQVYQSTHGAGQYGNLDQLAELGLITPELSTGFRYGYKFTVDVNAGVDGLPRFQAVGVPVSYGSSGIRSFYVDESGVIRAGDNRGGRATERNTPLNQNGYSSSSPPRRRSVSDY